MKITGGTDVPQNKSVCDVLRAKWNKHVMFWEQSEINKSTPKVIDVVLEHPGLCTQRQQGSSAHPTVWLYQNSDARKITINACSLSIKYTTWHLQLFTPSHTATFGCCWPFYRSPLWLRLPPLDCLSVSKVYGTQVITAATKQVLAHLVMNVSTTNLKIKRTHKLHLQVPNLQVSCSHLAGMRGYQESGFSNGCQATCPIVGQFQHQKGWHIRAEWGVTHIQCLCENFVTVIKRESWDAVLYHLIWSTAIESSAQAQILMFCE